ncbi:MAG: nucleotide exchange factor GrpE [Roseburia sp.]|nr:nucleotide exchange factor GrpE [Roseburia sp.]
MAEQEKEIFKEEAAGADAVADSDMPEGEEAYDAETSEGEAPDASEPDSENAAADDGEPVEEARSWSEKRAAKKQAKQDKKADGYKEQIEQLEDKVKRQLAEFENFRNRSEREKQAMFETGAKSVIEKILPVVDNFERGFAMVDPEDENDAFVDGMNKVYKQLMVQLEEIGVKPIEAIGQEFDPNLHNAVMQVESGEYESGMIAQELQKGYTYRDNVVRHSMVAVAE